MPQPPPNSPTNAKQPQAPADGQQPWWSTPGAVMPGQTAPGQPQGVVQPMVGQQQQQQQQQPAAAPESEQAFGFAAGAKDEKYNTEYLVQNLAHDRKRAQMIVVGVIVAALLGVFTWFALSPKDTTPKLQQTQAMPLDAAPAKSPPTAAPAPAPASEAKPNEAVVPAAATAPSKPDNEKTP